MASRGKSIPSLVCPRILPPVPVSGSSPPDSETVSLPAVHSDSERSHSGSDPNLNTFLLVCCLCSYFERTGSDSAGRGRRRPGRPRQCGASESESSMHQAPPVEDGVVHVQRGPVGGIEAVGTAVAAARQQWQQRGNSGSSAATVATARQQWQQRRQQWQQQQQPLQWQQQRQP
jgi:hypothetical protein